MVHISEAVEKNIDRPVTNMWQFARVRIPNNTRWKLVKNVYYLIAEYLTYDYY
jgi:hypothetical protein